MSAAYWILCNVVVLQLLLVGDYGLLSLTVYNSTMVPPTCTYIVAIRTSTTCKLIIDTILDHYVYNVTGDNSYK